MNRRRTYLTATVLVFAAGLFMFSPSASAAPGQNITITPTSVDTTLAPGTTNHGSFRVINQGTGDYTFSAYAAPYSVTGEDYNPDFVQIPGTTDVASWFKLSIDKAHLAPNESLTVEYTVSVPANAAPGGYYAVGFVETRIPKNSATPGLTINERVGELFYLRVAGDVKEKANLESWQTSFFQTAPLTSVLRLKNEGGTHFASEIQIVVSDLFGHDKFKQQTLKEVLPQTIRRVKLAWPGTPSIGLYKVHGYATVLDQKHAMPTSYVLVVSTEIRVMLTIIAIIIVLLGVIRIVRSRNAPKSHKRKR